MAGGRFSVGSNGCRRHALSAYEAGALLARPAGPLYFSCEPARTLCVLCALQLGAE